MKQQESEKKILWYSLAFMAFSTVWGFGNVINGFSEYGGLKAIISWVIIFAIYFVPYALMVGELGSAFKDVGGGVSSWILETISPNGHADDMIVHMLIFQKPSASFIAASWAIFRDNRISSMKHKSAAGFMSGIIPVCRLGGIQGDQCAEKAIHTGGFHHVYHVPAVCGHDAGSSGYHSCKCTGYRLVCEDLHAVF